MSVTIKTRYLTYKISDSGGEIKIFTSLKPGTNLYFDGEMCVVTDALGYEIERPTHIGTPILLSGENEAFLIREGDTSRARLTVITDGELLQ